MRRAITMVLVTASVASAEVVARFEPGFAQPISAPTRDYFGLGFTLGSSIGFDLLPFLETGAHFSYVFVSRRSSSPLGGPASLITAGPFARLHRPLDASWRPYLELALQYVRTGPLDRLGLLLSAGVHFELGGFSVGPWVGVQQVFRLTDEELYPTRDATVLLGGLSLELTFGTEAIAIVEPKPVIIEPPRVPPPAPSDDDGDGVKGAFDRCPSIGEDLDGFDDDDGCPDPDDDGDGVLDGDDVCPRRAGTAATYGCPDKDLDAVADPDDRCPDLRGEREEAGCPAHKDVKVRPPRIELLRPLGFAAGSSAIASTQPLLDAAARAITDRGALCVHVVGHGDARGKPNANRALASARGEAVRTYLIGRGIAPSRITAAGDPRAEPFGDAELSLVPCEVQAP